MSSVYLSVHKLLAMQFLVVFDLLLLTPCLTLWLPAQGKVLSPSYTLEKVYIIIAKALCIALCDLGYMCSKVAAHKLVVSPVWKS